MAADFLGRNTTNSARRCGVPGPGCTFGPKRVAMHRRGGKSGVFYRHICACGGFVSTKESCDFGEAAILCRLSGWGPCVGVVAGGRRQGAPADPRSVSLGASSSRNVNTGCRAPRGKHASLRYTRLYLSLGFLLDTFPSVGRRAARLDSGFVGKGVL